MATEASHDVTRLLQSWSDGDEAALDELVLIVQPELRRVARRYMARERAGHTLQTTALINEVYLRLLDWRKLRWQDRAHFFAVSASLMRRTLVDHARRRRYRKRGGGTIAVSLDDAGVVSIDRSADLVAIDDALHSLAALDPRKSQVVELRFFGGLSVEETAEVLKISPTTVKREWRLARAWLYSELGGVSADARPTKGPKGRVAGI
jgi:RNA polymerase sigma factor (TIGR02999 family)